MTGGEKGLAMQSVVLREVVESEVFDELQRRLVRNFIDIVVLKELSNKSLNGYEVIAFIHRKFNILLSSGTVYSQLYYLERKGLIQCHLNHRRRDYVLTEKGRGTLRAIMNIKEKIKAVMQILL